MGEKNWEGKERERERGKPRKENTFGDYTIYMTIDTPLIISIYLYFFQYHFDHNLWPFIGL